MYLKLLFKMHNHLSDPCHECLFSADFKHAYYIIPLHSENHHYFTFIISKIGQIQPTYIQQRSKSAGFIMMEMMYRAFRFVPLSKLEPFLFHLENLSTFSSITHYMNDIFKEFSDFEHQFFFFKNHFFSKIQWAKLWLAFKKLHLFESRIKALRVNYIMRKHIHILNECVKKIANWLISQN